MTKHIYLRDNPVINFGYPFIQNRRGTFFRIITAGFSLLLNMKESTSAVPLDYASIDPTAARFKEKILENGGG